jgi:hypothetical protein
MNIRDINTAIKRVKYLNELIKLSKKKEINFKIFKEF